MNHSLTHHEPNWNDKWDFKTSETRNLTKQCRMDRNSIDVLNDDCLRQIFRLNPVKDILNIERYLSTWKLAPQIEKLRITLSESLRKTGNIRSSNKNSLLVTNFPEKLKNSYGYQKIFKNSPKIKKWMKIIFLNGDR